MQKKSSKASQQSSSTKKIHRNLEQDWIYYPLPVYQRLGLELFIEDSSVATGGEVALRHTLSHRFKIFELMRCLNDLAKAFNGPQASVQNISMVRTP